MKNYITIDFETEAISSALPPRPVGVAIKFDHDTSYYYTNLDHAKHVISSALDVGYIPIFHNAAFDTAIMKVYWNIDVREFEDTLYLVFLHNPFGKLALKEASEIILEWPPEERDLVKEWILRRVPKATKSNWGGFICKAPSELVAPYACGDVDRTWALFCRLRDFTQNEPYLRETALMPYLRDNTLRGVKIDEERLSNDIVNYEQVLINTDNYIFKMLSAKPFNINSGEELANALEKSGMQCNWVYTEKSGKRSTSADNLKLAITDAHVLEVLDYRNKLYGFLNTYMKSWAAKLINGRIHFGWNQVRNYERKDVKGTRTGRATTVPSIVNIPNLFDVPEGFYALPNVKSYILPDEGQLVLKRDFASQELRILAHFEDDILQEAYIKEPNLDMHAKVAQIINKVTGNKLGEDFSTARRIAKTIAFSILYGQGISELAKKLQIGYNEAANLKAAYYTAIPGIKVIQQQIKAEFKEEKPIATLGGRHYNKEPHPTRDLTYKGLNYLIQGSGADLTKQAVLDYCRAKKDGNLLMVVYDDITITGTLEEMEILKQAMEESLKDKLKVPILSDGYTGPNYGQLTKQGN